MDNGQMINLFYSRSDTDHLEYIFTQAAQWTGAGGKALVIVPDQYTLETERKAFAVLQTEGLMDLQIMSFSRMAAKLTGGGGLEMKYIDDLGRTMLLRKVLSDNRDKLTIFSPAAERSEFVRMMGNMIQEFKQFETSPETIEEAAESSGSAGGLLQKKLADTAVIYRAYEEELKGRYLDTEDQLTLLCREIRQTAPFEGWAVYVTGFDFYSKRLVSVMEALAEKAASLNVVMHYVKPGDPAYNLFAPLEATVSDIRGIAGRTGKTFRMEEIGEEFRIPREEDLARAAEDLYRFPCREWAGKPEHIELLACEDRETELEWAADEICRLVREEGLRYRDIAVAANDLEERRASLQRIFRRAGIRYFDGRSTMAVTNKYMQFLLGLCDLESPQQRTDAFLRILSTGVPEVSREDAEKLENYLVRYGSEGWRWEQAFTRLDRTRIEPEEAEEQLKALNEVREKLMDLKGDLDRRLADCGTGRQYGEAFFAFLQERAQLGDKIQADADRLKEAGDLEYSAVTVQLWNKITLLFGQLTEVLGDAPCTREAFFEILRTGVESTEIRMIPTTIDQVLVTDIKRSGPEGVKALFLLGVNEGVLPRRGTDPGILNDREKEKLNGLAGEVCLSGRHRPEQEKLEIYRTFSLAQNRLIISYLRGGEEELQPSLLIERIRRIFPGLETQEVEAIREGPLAQILLQARKEYMEQHPEEDRQLELLELGENYRNAPESIGPGLFGGLYGDEIRMSPTSLENYARCPFAHFLRYGLRAEEQRPFELSSPELGTVFHEILMRFSREMSERNRWSVADEKLCRNVVGEFAGKVAEDFRQGQLFEGPEGEYRLSRVRGICEKTAVMVAHHINKGKFRRFYFEMAFGKDRSIPALELNPDSGSPVYIEGRIDRIDIAEEPGRALLKIIDYKSGSDTVSEPEIRKGYRMQLMMYMLAAKEGMERRYREVGPAGVFYFHIKEPTAGLEPEQLADPERAADLIEKEFRKTYRMDGIVVNEPEIIEAIDEEFSGYSDIIRVRRLNNGTVKGNSKFSALDRLAFEELLQEARTTAEGFARDFTEGKVSVSPMRVDADNRACKYCPYSSICGFDEDLPGFEYR
jgi:ATP-dependent helicase/nuclease subunit B